MNEAVLHLCDQLRAKRPWDSVLRVEPIGVRWGLRTILYVGRDDGAERPGRRRYSGLLFIAYCPFCGEELEPSRVRALRWLRQQVDTLATGGTSLPRQMDVELELAEVRREVEQLLEELNLRSELAQLRDASRGSAPDRKYRVAEVAHLLGRILDAAAERA